jgi:hypothetical protein
MSRRPLKKEDLSGLNAQEACKRISTEAENIAATAKVVQEAWGPLNLLNPNAWKAEGDLKTEVRNITNIDMSDNDVKEMMNKCEASTLAIQKNIIDNTNCEYCKRNLCTIHNVTQKNTSEQEARCRLQAVMEFFAKNTDEVQQLAAMEAIQKSTGLLSSAQAEGINCNYVNKDMSSNEYLKNVQSCNSKLAVDQTNVLKGCGLIYDIIQENSSKQWADCLVATTFTDKKETSSKTTQTAKTKMEQIVEGFTPLMSFGSLCCCCIILLLICGLPLILKMFGKAAGGNNNAGKIKGGGGLGKMKGGPPQMRALAAIKG